MVGRRGREPVKELTTPPVSRVSISMGDKRLTGTAGGGRVGGETDGIIWKEILNERGLDWLDFDLTSTSVR